MKVGFLDKKRKLNEWPTSMTELRKLVSRKFTEKNLLDDLESPNLAFESQQSMVSYLKQSKNHVNKRRQLIDWQNVTLFYEDSEGDFNVISEEEDIHDAKKYANEKSQTYLNCNIVDKTTFEMIRGE